MKEKRDKEKYYIIWIQLLEPWSYLDLSTEFHNEILSFPTVFEEINFYVGDLDVKSVVLLYIFKQNSGWSWDGKQNILLG